MRSRNSLLIHAFALLHCATVLVCSYLGTNDSLILTFLTMLLAVIICVRKKLPIEFTAISIVLMNIIGFALGVWIARLVVMVIPNTTLAHAIATLITTEIVGWALVWFSDKFGPKDSTYADSNRVRQTFWLVAAIVAIFAVRVMITLMMSGKGGEDSISAFSDFLGNPVALLLIVAACILFIQSFKRSEENMEYAGKVMVFVLFFVVMILLAALFVALKLPLHFDLNISGAYFGRLLLIAVIAVAAIFSLVYVADYALEANRRLQAERDRANRASFQYMSLKQQVNPHFLFNSLNVLDALVCDGKSEDASKYIHKLAGIYRYMLQNEREEVVSLRDELEFARAFADLLKLRFPQGLVFNISLQDSDLKRFVVPCSLQLLIENATKHNSISAENPLTVEISSNGEEICVRNNIIPKLTPVSSTGLGLNYIRQQYLDICGNDIDIQQDTDFFTVKMPLI